jgi:hypothetical protein
MSTESLGPYLQYSKDGYKTALAAIITAQLINKLMHSFSMLTMSDSTPTNAED